MRTFRKSIKGCGLSVIKSILIFVIPAAIFFTSCSTEVTLTLKQDDSLEISFEGGAGQAFAKMISSAAGLGTSNDTDILIDTDAVSYELAKAGFSNVKINQKKNGSVAISMLDKKQTSYLFTSKIIKTNKGSITAAITRKSLEDFYASSDEQTRMILDLFLAPVFNNEEMTEDEYIEMLGAFYGTAAADEVKQSFLVINLISKDGSREKLKIPFTQFFCGNFVL